MGLGEELLLLLAKESYRIPPFQANNREDAYSRTGGSFIRDTARHTAYSL